MKERHWTPAKWLAGATADGLAVWREAAGRHEIVTVERGDPRRIYGLRGPCEGTITVTGDGPGDAWRHGAGDGDARREGIGKGDAVRTGTGRGTATQSSDRMD